MIQVTVFRDNDNQICGFTVKGHAGYADSGKDIICAAVSVLTINAINSIELLTDDIFTSEMEEESGNVSFFLTNTGSLESQLLLESFVLGIIGIKENYGKQYLDFKTQAYGRGGVKSC